jgi:hypothetical protein
LIALVVMSQRWEWMPIAMAPTFSYLSRGEWQHGGIPSTAIYAAAALLTGALGLAHRRLEHRHARGEPAGTP